MTTIPASSLVPGDRVVRCEPEPGLGGWSVATTSGRVVVFNDQPVGDAVTLLNLERTTPGESYYYKNVEYWRDDVTETRSAWLRADTMLTVERSSE